MLQLLHFSWSVFNQQKSFSYKGSYFTYRGEAPQIFWICFGRELSGRVPSEGVCMGECTQIFWIRFGG